MFLSGGQSEEEATVNLNAINKLASAQGSLILGGLSITCGEGGDALARNKSGIAFQDKS
jgi:hypothetical protein